MNGLDLIIMIIGILAVVEMNWCEKTHYFDDLWEGEE